MGSVLALALAAAVYPQLVAVVVLILTRPEPKRLLWACYLGALGTNVACAAAVLAVFKARGSIAGTSARSLGAGPYLSFGVAALVLALCIGTGRGREVFSGDLPILGRRRRERQAGSPPLERLKLAAERGLKRSSLPIAVAFGALLGIPGPFDLLAVGHMARGRYATIVLVLMIAAFYVIKFVLIELPIISFAVQPEATAARVTRFSTWMSVHKDRVLATVVGVIGAVLISRGISMLS